MSHTALLPFTAKDILSEFETNTLDPIYYQLWRESFPNKAQRKLGLQKPATSLERRLGLSPRDVANLSEVQAIWLSPEFGLPIPQFEYFLDRMPSLRWAYWQRTGTDNMHSKLFKTRGIALSNSGSLVSRAVAEMNLACILAQAKRLPDHFSLQRRRHWETLLSEDLGSQTTGIIGTGNIATETAKLCRAIDMSVTAASRNPALLNDKEHPFDHVYHLRNELDTLLKEADYIVIAIPLNEETRNLIGKKQFKAMRSSATLINPARHQIIDENALCTALSDNLIAAAYLDVLFNRRLYFWDRIYRTKNLYLTHYSSAHFRNKQQKALESFLYGLEHEAKTGIFPDRVV